MLNFIIELLYPSYNKINESYIKDKDYKNKITKTNSMRLIYYMVKYLKSKGYKPILLFDIDDTFIINSYGKNNISINKHIEYLMKILDLIEGEENLYFVTARVKMEDDKTIEQLIKYIQHKYINFNSKIIFCGKYDMQDTKKITKYDKVLKIKNDIKDCKNKWFFFIDDIHRHVKNVHDILNDKCNSTCILFDDIKINCEEYLDLDCLIEFMEYQI